MPASVATSRAKAFKRQSGRCFYCDLPMWLSEPGAFAERYKLKLRQTKAFRATAEHLIARCDGGSNCAHNIAAACYFCNSKRHARPTPLAPERYREHVRRRIAAGRWNAVQFAAAACSLPAVRRKGRGRTEWWNKPPLPLD